MSRTACVYGKYLRPRVSARLLYRGFESVAINTNVLVYFLLIINFFFYFMLFIQRTVTGNPPDHRIKVSTTPRTTYQTTAAPNANGDDTATIAAYGQLSRGTRSRMVLNYDGTAAGKHRLSCLRVGVTAGETSWPCDNNTPVY